MVITDAEYVSSMGVNRQVKARVDGEELWIPMNPDNRHYAEILRQVEAGELTIAEAKE